ncbi:S8 family peptidase [Neolewinella antarctica]|uniref:Peptidase S8/S53 domain-containing protein n=1 Tax=Neolewinella antarctica TaxID=442734 RepID=A0ABX0XE56_9BACT|nr:S8/S53 family peptidase [Neolewinella antarctica]NJC27594.1 hypothetical protein [Neolewinella antarctica]
MISRNFTFQAVAAALCVFLFFACDLISDPPKPPGGDEDCEVKLTFLDEMNEDREPIFDIPDEHYGGEKEERYGLQKLPKRQFRLPIPASGKSVVHVYNDYPYGYHIRAFAVRGTDLLQLDTVVYTKAKFASFEFSFDQRNADDYLLLEIHYQRDGHRGPVSNEDYIGFVAYDGQPSQTVETDKLGRPLRCDGKTPKCYVLSTCVDGMDLENWAREMGLIVNERFDREDGNPYWINACVSPDINLNTTDPEGKEIEVRNDTINGSMEMDFPFTLSPLLIDPLGTPLRAIGRVDGEDNQDRNPVATNPGSDEIGKKILCIDDIAPRNGNGDELIVTIIDTGVSEDGSGRLNWRMFENQTDRSPYLPAGKLGYDFTDRDNQPQEEIEHGTAVAAALALNYTGDRRLTIVHHKIFSPDGEANYSNAIESIYAAVKHGTDVLNLSWGITSEKAPAALACAIKYALGEGITIVTSAGNQGSDIDSTPQWPAAFSKDHKGLYAVGSHTLPDLSVNANHRRTLWSGHGKENVDAYAFQAAWVPVEFGSRYYFRFGTSISAPLFVSHLVNKPNRIGLPADQLDLEEVATDFFLHNDPRQPRLPNYLVLIQPVTCPKGAQP